MPSFRRRPRRNRPVLADREAVLVGWRGSAWVEAEGNRTAPIRGMTELVPNVLSSMRLEERVAQSQIVKVWQSAVDPTIATHAVPSGFMKGTLFVSVDSNAWLSEIVRYHREEILERLQNVIGRDQLKKISFRLG